MGNWGHVVLLVGVWAGIVTVGCWALACIRAEIRWRRAPKHRRDRLTWESVLIWLDMAGWGEVGLGSARQGFCVLIVL